MEAIWLDYFGLSHEIAFDAFCAAGGAIVIISFCNIIVGCMKRNGSFGFIDHYVSVGSIVIVLTVLLRGCNSAWHYPVSQSAFNGICQVYDMFLMFGLTMFFGGLCCGSWAIHVHRSKKTTEKRRWLWNLTMFCLVLIMAVLAIVWTLVHPPQVTVDWLLTNPTDSSVPVYRCSGPHDYEWKIAVSAWHGLIFLVALISIPFSCKAVCKKKEINSTMYSFLLTISIVNIACAIVAGLCVYFLKARKTYSSLANLSFTGEYSIYGGLELWCLLIPNSALLTIKLIKGGFRNDPGQQSNEHTLDRQRQMEKIYNEIPLDDKSDLSVSHISNGYYNNGFTMNERPGEEGNATIQFKHRYNHGIDF